MRPIRASLLDYCVRVARTLRTMSVQQKPGCTGCGENKRTITKKGTGGGGGGWRAEGEGIRDEREGRRAIYPETNIQHQTLPRVCDQTR